MSDTVIETGNTPKVEEAENSPIESSERMFTQEQVNKLVGEARRKATNKNENYELYKQAYEELEAIKQANKSELERAQEKASKLEAELGELKHAQEIQRITNDIALEMGVPADVLRGNSEEEIRKHAETLQATFVKAPAPHLVKNGTFATSEEGKTKASILGDAIRQASNV